MAVIVPTVGRNKFLQLVLNQTLTLKLFSNNIVPAITDTNATYTEVTGGGYVNKPLVYADWTLVDNLATYLARDFNFTGVIGGSGIVYGFYIVDAANIVLQSEKFSSSVTPINGSLIRITPKFRFTQ